MDKLIELVDQAMVKYRKARRIAVSNFSSGYSSMSYECRANLQMDTRLYSWKAPTVNAIKWVIGQREKLGI